MCRLTFVDLKSLKGHVYSHAVNNIFYCPMCPLVRLFYLYYIEGRRGAPLSQFNLKKPSMLLISTNMNRLFLDSALPLFTIYLLNSTRESLYNGTLAHLCYLINHFYNSLFTKIKPTIGHWHDFAWRWVYRYIELSYQQLTFFTRK